MKINKLILSTIRKEVKKLSNLLNYIDAVSFTYRDESTLDITVVGYPSDIETTMTLKISLAQIYDSEPNYHFQIDVQYTVNSAWFGKGALQWINGDFINFDTSRVAGLIDHVYKYNN